MDEHEKQWLENYRQNLIEETLNMLSYHETMWKLSRSAGASHDARYHMGATKVIEKVLILLEKK